MGIISLRLLNLVSFCWFHPKTLVYVMSRVLRTLWGHDLTYSAWRLTHRQYLRLVGEYFLEHDEWGIDAMDYIGAYPSYQWWIFRGDVIYTGAYPAHRWRFLLGWWLALRHNQFASSLGLWCHLDFDGLAVVGWPYTGGVVVLESAFIGDTVTLLDILHWDTLLSLMTYWGIVVSLAMDYGLSWSIVTSDGLYWSIAWMESIFHWNIATLFGSFTLGHIHLLEGDQIGSWYWSIWRVIWRSLDYFMLSSLHTGA